MAKLFSLITSKEIHLAPGAKMVPASEFSLLVDAQTILKTIEEESTVYKQ